MAEQRLITDRLEISWGREWGVYYVVCPACNYYMTIVAAVGSPPGCTCTRCGAYDPDMGWHGMEDEMTNDGAWLAPIRNPVIDMQWPRGERET